MAKKELVKIFEERKVRSVWDEEQEIWYFSVLDVVGILVDSKDYQTARKYWNKLKQRLKEEGFQPVTHCHGFGCSEFPDCLLVDFLVALHSRHRCTHHLESRLLVLTL